MQTVKQFWWLVAFAWQSNRASEGHLSGHLQPVRTGRGPNESPQPDTLNMAPDSEEFQSQLIEAKAPIRWYGDPRDIYLA